MENVKYLLILALLTISAIKSAYSKDQDEAITLVKHTDEIQIDGILDEPVWSKLEPLPMSMYVPVNGDQPSERTEIMITYDDTYIYLGARMYVSDPNYIMVNTYARDVPTDGSEFVFFFTSDYQNMEGFSINPVGKRVDAQMLCNTDCNNWFNPDWNIIWQGNSVITPEGWFTEVRIPISSLNFTLEDDQLTFGFLAHRLIGAKNERVTFPNIAPEWPNGIFRAALARKMRIENIRQRKPLYVTPYALGKVEQQGDEPEDFAGAFGIDIRFKVSNNSTLDLTYNTDFAQAESDDQQINLTQFSLFYPEKRQFFQERSGIFSFSTGGNERLFYSRRIGLSDTGQPVKILGGLRSVSRFGNWDVGLLTMQTDQTGDIEGENFGVFRAKRNVLNPSSFIGGMITSRVANGGGTNLNLGLDATLNLFSTDYVMLKAINTQEEGTQLNLKSSFLSVEWKRPSDVNLGYEMAVEHRGEKYNPAVGFVTRKDHLAARSKVSYGWFAKDQSRIRNYGPIVENYAIRNYSRELIEYNFFNTSWAMRMKSNNTLSVGFQSIFQDIDQGFNLSNEVEIPLGQYNAQSVFFDYTMNGNKLLRMDMNLQTGELYDGTGYTLTLNPTWTQSKRLELSSLWQVSQYDFVSRNQELYALLMQFRARFSLNTKLSINLLSQYNTTTSQIGINTRLRYNFQDGHDIYVVYNASQNYTLDIRQNTSETPNNNMLEQRGLFIKYLYTFVK